MKAFLQTALRFRDELDDCLDDIEADAFILDENEVDELAIALTDLAEDLHANSGLWRSLEAYHREFFDVSLPLLCKAGEPGPEKFDPRRFQFFLYSVWRHFRPDHVISPGHRGFQAIAGIASKYFSQAFAAQPQRSAVADFLAKPNRRGWDVKRKLVWVGTRSFLFRFAFRNYMRGQEIQPGEEIEYTDDFLCQECTEWSGLGAVDILAMALDLPEADRVELRTWHARHAAFYRIDNMNLRSSKVETLDVMNLINEQPYRIRLEMDWATCPFRVGQMVFGSLVPWRGEWYWSGAQRPFKSVPKDFASIRREFREQNAGIAYRYCADLERRAREISDEHLSDFRQFHGSDFAVFPDGLTAAAAEQKRLRIYSEVKAGNDLERILEKHGIERFGQGTYPPEFIDNDKGVAVFYHEGEGTEMMVGYGALVSSLKKKDEPLIPAEMEILQDFVETDTISPAFVRRVIGEVGSSGLEKFYFLPEGTNGIEYLLRRFKGRYFRKRYPRISLRE